MIMGRRQMHLVAYLKTGPTALHVGGWRHPEATLDDILEPSRYQHIARVLEDAKFDGCFFADLFGLYDVHQGSFESYVRRGGADQLLGPDRGAAGDGRCHTASGAGGDVVHQFSFTPTILRGGWRRWMS